MRRAILVLGALALCLPQPARADGFGYRGWGPRVGLSMDPDQVVFGAHLDLSEAPGRFRLQPNIEMGLGDNLVTLGFNIDGAYRFASRWEQWTPYLGGEMGIRVFSDDENGLRDETGTDTGLSLLGGIDRGLSSGSRFFLEAKLGFVDAPDVRVLAGWTFHP
jgi:hypothetical protein